MKNIIILIGSLMMMGCYPATEWVVSEDNDPNFIEAVKKANEAWCEHNAKPCLPFRIGDDANIFYRVTDDKSYIGLTRVEIFQSNKIIISSLCPKISWAWTVAHEMGHASTNVQGHANSKGVMSSDAVPYSEREVLVITKEDLDLVNGE
jgi:hypothetical protein